MNEKPLLNFKNQNNLQNLQNFYLVIEMKISENFNKTNKDEDLVESYSDNCYESDGIDADYIIYLGDIFITYVVSIIFQNAANIFVESMY